jgi:hypothetical protein
MNLFLWGKKKNECELKNVWMNMDDYIFLLLLMFLMDIVASAEGGRTSRDNATDLRDGSMKTKEAMLKT